MTESSSQNPVAKVVSLTLLIFQATAMPLLARHSRIRATDHMYVASTLVFVTEIAKVLLGVTLLCIQEKSIRRGLRSIFVAIVREPKDTLRVCIPSLIYVGQNNLYYVGLSNLDVATFQVSSQLRILLTAIFAVALLSKRLSKLQWASLIILTIGVCLVQLHEQLASTSTQVLMNQRPAIGLLAVVSSSTMSGFACIYFEKILKGSQTSVFIQNIRLAVAGIPLSAIMMISSDLNHITKKGVLYGFDSLIWVMVFMGAAGGVIIAAVMKYADNILKTYAQSFAIVTACIGSGLLFGFEPTVGFVFGTILVLVSIYMYDRFPVSSPGTTREQVGMRSFRNSKAKLSEINLVSRA